MSASLLALLLLTAAPEPVLADARPPGRAASGGRGRGALLGQSAAGGRAHPASRRRGEGNAT